MTDPLPSIEEELLERVLRFELHVCWQTLDVHYYHRRRRRWYRKKPDRHPESGRARFRFGSKRQTVYRNRLFFIYFRRRIPSGFVDHADGDRLNDHPANLRDQSPEDSHRQGYESQTERNFREVMDYFDDLAFFNS